MPASQLIIRSVRRQLRPLRKAWAKLLVRSQELPYRFRRGERGSAAWLISKETIYGGYVTAVPRRKVSPKDDRSREQLDFHGMTGGDRMLHHQYAPVYARYLHSFLETPDVTLAEFGILKGTGLAIWCDLFPRARIIGFDIDLSHFEENSAVLRQRGAFEQNSPELYEFDQLEPDLKRLNLDLAGARLDVVIDDGLHSLEAIINNWNAVKPYLAKRCVYFIEDFGRLLETQAIELEGFTAKDYGLMTVISRGIQLD